MPSQCRRGAYGNSLAMKGSGVQAFALKQIGHEAGERPEQRRVERLHGRESAGRDLQAGDAGEAERDDLILKAACEVAGQPGVQRDFQAERHRIGQHQGDGDIAGPHEHHAAQVAAAPRGVAALDGLGSAAANQVPGGDQKRDHAQPQKRAPIVGAENARQQQRADAGADIAGPRVQSLGGADLVRVEPLRHMLNADDK
jgi:hypothetical protein